MRKKLSFRDGTLEDFDKLMVGVKAGDTREGKVKLSECRSERGAARQDDHGRIRSVGSQEARSAGARCRHAAELGRFENEGELRDAMMGELKRQLDYHQQQRARQQMTAALTAAANWDLPPDLLRRQSVRELERSVLELRRSGFSDDEIRHALRTSCGRTCWQTTARSLKEHFILEKIAEEEKIEDLPEDYDAEIRLIAAQSGESVRRVRAQLEKRDLMDILRNQIIERKTID